ncbi:kinase-like domain-containing protein [Coprinopsis sp. MPI-PUGE-AT-0042]|nr:kinase-like domain-containing protein [Coprinopsis sp. MPI-PUGE-AT-0042]
MTTASTASMQDVLEDETDHHAIVMTGGWGYSPGDTIDDHYAVRKVRSRNGPAQLLLAFEMEESMRVVLKVVHKTMVQADDYFLDLEALHSMRGFDEAGALLLSKSCSIVRRRASTFFPEEGVSLQGVLNNKGVVPFTPRQVREIVLQLTHALDFLHENEYVHADLCPSNIRFVSGVTSKERWYNTEDGTFSSRRALRSTQLKVCFFGALGVTHRLPNHDRYCSPELCAEIDLTFRMDHFSLGCIMAELLIDKPLFCDCSTSFLYVRDKLWVMESILGDIPHDLAEKIEAHCGPDIFTNYGRVDTTKPIEPLVKDWVDGHGDLSSLIRDRDALDVLRNLMAYEADERAPFYVLRHSWSYFVAA